METLTAYYFFFWISAWIGLVSLYRSFLMIIPINFYLFIFLLNCYCYCYNCNFDSIILNCIFIYFCEIWDDLLCYLFYIWMDIYRIYIYYLWTCGDIVANPRNIINDKYNVYVLRLDKILYRFWSKNVNKFIMLIFSQYRERYLNSGN